MPGAGRYQARANGLDLLSPRSPLQVRDDGFAVCEYGVTPRIGIRHAVEWPLRFLVAESPCVSGPKSFAGKCVSIK